MTSIATTHDTFSGREPAESDPTAAIPTGRTSTAWATGRGEDAQSATFRALAWSQDDDSIAEPLPYAGDGFVEFAAPAGGAVERPYPPRDRRSALPYGVAAGFVAVAVGGLALALLNTGGVPTTTSPVVVQPAERVVDAVSPQPVQATAPAPGSGAAPVRPVPTAAKSPQAVVNAPAVAAATPAAAKPAQVAAPEVVPPKAAPPVAPPAAAPAAPPVVVNPPIVSIAPFTPPPVAPPILWIPPAPKGPMAPMPNLGDVLPPALKDPSVVKLPPAPAASDPVISVDPGAMIPPIVLPLP